MEQHNLTFHFQPDPNDRWIETTCVIDQTEPALKRLLGLEDFRIKNKNNGNWESCDLKQFALSGYPSLMLDVIEVFHSEIPDAADKHNFQVGINDSMLAFGCPWRLSDGEFFRVDSEFLQHVLEQSTDLLHSAGFEGALDEFHKARSDLEVGDTKDAIHKANDSCESTLKTILGAPGTASDLCKKLGKDGYLDDLPLEARQVVINVLTGLSLLRHKLGGHGQGLDVVDVPRPYAELAVALAAAFNSFAVQKHLQRSPPPPQSQVPAFDDEIPF